MQAMQCLYLSMTVLRTVIKCWYIVHFAVTINSIRNPLISICGQTTPCLPVVWLLKLSIMVNKHCAFGTCHSDLGYWVTPQMKDVYFITFRKEKSKLEPSGWGLVRAKALPRITSPDTLPFAFTTLLEAKVRRIESSSINIIRADTAILLVYSPICPALLAMLARTSGFRTR